MFHASRGRLLLPFVLLVIAMIGVRAANTPAPAPAAPAGAVGVIELDKVTHDYKGWASAQALLGAYYKGHQGILDDLEKGVGLPADEFEEYRRLAGSVVKVNPARITELETKAKGIQEDYRGLHAKTTPTDDEKKRLEAMDKLVKDEMDSLNAKRETYDASYNDLVSRYTKALLAQLDKALAQVATDKKLTIVVSRDIQVPDPQTQRVRTERFVIWGGLDITPDVTKVLNDSFKDSMLAEAAAAPAAPTAPAGPVGPAAPAGPGR